MKVFISWSGPSSQAAAELLHTYLPCILQDLRPFVSSHDLSSGGRWSGQLSKELDESSFGIICLTPENLHSDWILFEAGALTKHIEGRACCLLLQNLGPADISGPLAQFQNRLFTRSEFGKLITDLNSCLPTPLPGGSLELIFDKWWPDIEMSVHDAVAKAGHAPTSSRREPINILEEVLLRIRTIQKQLEATESQHGPSETEITEIPRRRSFRITLRRMKPEINDLSVPLDGFMTFQAVLDDIYTSYLMDLIPQSSYGTTWVLRDVDTGSVIAHSRMRADGSVESGIRDHRKLTEVGIRPGSTLEAIMVADLNAA